MNRPRFHLAIPVDDLEAGRAFYGGVLGFAAGRSAARWADFEMYGHQLVIHEMQHGSGAVGSNPVDGDQVPVPHFGVLLDPLEWRVLADRIIAAGIEFVVEPHVRFEGQVGEHHTLFLLDPSGNALEFKAFVDDSQVFAT